MGAILSRWRKKASTIEVLEQIDKDVEQLQKLRRTNVEKQRRLIGSLILYSVVLYALAAVVIYLYYFPDRWSDRLVFLSPLLIFPLLVWLLKKLLHWYFVKRIAKNESALEELRDKKKEILEEVMEKETYKKAKEILEKFDPERFKKLEEPKKSPTQAAPSRAPDGQELRQRGMAQAPLPATPSGRGVQAINQSFVTPSVSRPGPQQASSVAPQAGRGRGVSLPMPRPVLPRERTTVDRLVDYLVGDGPQNRFALVCSQCHSHNGMALKEEFEYLSFRCCYCYTLNPARKRKPFAPRLQFTPLPDRKFDPQAGSKPSAAGAENDDSSRECSPEGSSEESKVSGEEEEEGGMAADEKTDDVKDSGDIVLEQREAVKKESKTESEHLQNGLSEEEAKGRVED